VIPAALLAPKVIGPIVICVAIFGAGWMARGQIAAASIAKLEAAHAQAVSAAEKKAREAVESARKREADLVEQTRGIVDEARQTIQTLERSIGSADAASRGLQDAARRTVSRCTSSANPSSTGGSPGAIVPSSMSDGDRLLLVLGQLDGAAGAYATDSGRARAARNACEAAYTAAMKAINQ
jgi:hypothetical protein